MRTGVITDHQMVTVVIAIIPRTWVNQLDHLIPVHEGRDGCAVYELLARGADWFTYDADEFDQLR